MGFLVSFLVNLPILIFCLIMKIALVFIGYIEVFDILLVTGITWLGLTQSSMKMEGWTALAIGLILGALCYIIYKTKIGYWAVSFLFSSVWSCAFSSGICSLFKWEKVGFWVCFIVFIPVMMYLHAYPKYRKEIESEVRAEAKLESNATKAKRWF